MKKFILLGTMFISISAMAQVKTTIKVTNTVIDSKGVYRPIKASEQEEISTGGVYIDKDNIPCPVYRTTKGKLYIHKISKKTGTEYRKYLTI